VLRTVIRKRKRTGAIWEGKERLVEKKGAVGIERRRTKEVGK